MSFRHRFAPVPQPDTSVVPPETCIFPILKKTKQEKIFFVSTFLDWYKAIAEFSQSSEKINANRRKNILPIIGKTL